MDEYLPRPFGYRVDPVVSRQIAIATHILRGGQMTLNELNAAIIKWADDREITKYSTPYAQAFKTAEEVQELIEAVAKHGTGSVPGHNDYSADIRDAIGDIYVTLVVGMACVPPGDVPDRKDSVRAACEKPAHKTVVGCIQAGLMQVASSAPRTRTSTVQKCQLYCTFCWDMIELLERAAEQFDTTLEACVEQAYNAIKDRKGKLLPNGIFVKEE